MSAFRLTCGKSKCTALTFRRCASIDASAASAAATASAAAWLSPLSASVARRTAITEALLSDRPRVHQSFLYDARGVALYEGILGTPEYYLPAAEEALLQANLDALTAPLSSRLALVELGAGDGGRTRRLVERAAAQAAEPLVYAPADISAESLSLNEADFRGSEPLAARRAVCAPILADHEAAIDAAGGAFGAEGRELCFLFMGSSLGNFDDGEVDALFCRVGAWIAGGRGRLWLGLDSPHSPAKSAHRIGRAYNDEEGWTAAFTLNALSHVNDITGTDFDTADWRHVAEYDAASTSVFTHVEARRAVVLSVPAEGGGRRELRRFAAGERVFVEQSRKFSEEETRRLAEAAGLRLSRSWASDDYLIAELVRGSA